MATSPAHRYRRLRRLNVVAFAFLLAEGVYMLAASNSLALPVTASFLRDDPVRTTRPTLPETVFSLRIGPAVACFLLLAALDHALVAAPRVHRWYERGLDRHVNYARWIEYAVSASLMVVLIGLFVGITVVQFVLFFSFAANMALQYAQVGWWRDYVNGEITYIVLSLTSKSLLAWLLFANVLRT